MNVHINAMRAAQLACQRLEPFQPSRDKDEVETLCGQRLREGLANPGGRSRDERYRAILLCELTHAVAFLPIRTAESLQWCVCCPKNCTGHDVIRARLGTVVSHHPCCDGLKGFEDAITAAFGRTVVQRCVVHYADLGIMPTLVAESLARTRK